MSTITSDIVADNIIISGLFIGGNTKSVVFSTNSSLDSNTLVNNKENYVFGIDAFKVGITGNTSSGNIAFGPNAISTIRDVTGNIAIGNKYLLKQNAGNDNVLIGSNYIYTTNFDIDNLNSLNFYGNYNAEVPVTFSQNSQNIAIPGGYIDKQKIQSGYIYISKDGAQSFQIVKPYSGNLSGFGIFDSAFISSDGKYINAKMQNPSFPGDAIIFQSFDSGNNWQTLGNRNPDFLTSGNFYYINTRWYEVTQNLPIVNNTGGVTTGPFDTNPSEIFISSDGRYQLLGHRKSYRTNNDLIPPKSTLYVSDNYGISRQFNTLFTGTAKTNPAGGSNVLHVLAASDDIKYIAAAEPQDPFFGVTSFVSSGSISRTFIFSNNSGNSWFLRSGFPHAFPINDIAISEDGKTHVICGTSPNTNSGRYPFLSGFSGYIAVSRDFGATHSYVYNRTGIRAISISNDGKYQYCSPVQSGKLLYSNNSGLSFDIVTGVPNLIYTDMAISNDGKYVLAVSDVNPVGSRFGFENAFDVSDFGATFRGARFVPNTGLYSSQAINTSGTVFLSNNSGISWTSLFSGTIGYTSCDMTSDGRIQIISAYGGPPGLPQLPAFPNGIVPNTGNIYPSYRSLEISYDYGKTWINLESGTNISTIKLTNDGTTAIGLKSGQIYRIDAPFRSIFYDLNNSYHAGGSGYYNLEKISHYKTSDDGKYQVILTNITGYNPFNSGRFTRKQTIWNSLDSGKNWSYLHSLPDQTTQLSSPMEYGDFDYSLNGFALYGITKTFWPTGALGYGNIQTILTSTGVPEEGLDWVRVAPFVIKNINNALSEGDVISSQYKWQAPYYVFNWQGTFFPLGFLDAIGNFPYTGGRSLTWSARGPSNTTALNTPSRSIIDFPGNSDSGRLEKVFYYKDDLVDLYATGSATLPRNLTIKTSFKIFDLNENTDIFGNRNGAFGAYIKIQNDKIKTSIGSAYDSLGNPFEVTSIYSLKTGEFTNVTTTYNTQNKQICLYVNDLLDASGTYSYLIPPPYYKIWSGYVFNGASNTAANLVAYSGTTDGAKSGIQFLTTSLYTGALSRWYIEYKDYFSNLTSSTNGFYLAKNSNTHAVIDPNGNSGFAVFDPVTRDLFKSKEWISPTAEDLETGDYRPFFQDSILYFGITDYSMFGSENQHPLPNNIDLKNSKFGSIYINDIGTEVITLGESGFDNYNYYQSLQEFIPSGSVFGTDGYLIKYFIKIEIDSKDIIDQEYKVFPSRDFKQFILAQKQDDISKNNIYSINQNSKLSTGYNNIIFNNNVNFNFDAGDRNLRSNIFIPGVQRNFIQADENIILGYDTFDNTKTGNNNLVIGNNSLSDILSNNKHNKNLVIGNNSISTINSDSNISIGNQNLSRRNNYNKQIKNNISIGDQAGKYIGYEDRLITTSIIDSGISEITYGNNFISSEGIRDYGRGDISADGKYQVVPIVSESGQMYRSEDYGKTWNLVRINWGSGLPMNTIIEHVEMSADGRFLLAYGNIGSHGNTLRGSIDINQDPSPSTFLPTPFDPRRGGSTSYFYKSSDYGLNWSTGAADILATGYRSWADMAISSDGKYQALLLKDVDTVNHNFRLRPTFSRKGRIVYSEDYGSTWNMKDSPELPVYFNQSHSIAMNADGRYQGIYGSEGYYVSEDYGNTWQQSVAWPNSMRIAGGARSPYFDYTDAGVMDNLRGWILNDFGQLGDVAISDDGKFHAIFSHSPWWRRYFIDTSAETVGWSFDKISNTPNELLFSNDYGKTISYSSSITGYNFRGAGYNPSSGIAEMFFIDISSDGKYQIVLRSRYPDDAYVSINSGRSWTRIIDDPTRWPIEWGGQGTDFNRGLRTSSISSDGRCLLVAGKNTSIYTYKAPLNGFDLNLDDNILIGDQIGKDAYPLQNIIGVGSNNLSSGFHQDVISIGSHSYTGCVSAEHNINIGNNFFNFKTGNSNLAIGLNSFNRVQTGFNNLAIGHETLRNGLYKDNIAIGYRSQFGNLTSPVYNVNNLSIGNYTLTDDTDGSNNIAIGNLSLSGRNRNKVRPFTSPIQLVEVTSGISFKTSTSRNNLSIGHNSSVYNALGLSNITIGNNNSQKASNTNNNIILGNNIFTEESTSEFRTGDNNAMIGNRSALNISATSNNVLIGSNTLTKIDISEKNVIIGNKSITGILNTEFYVSEIIITGVTPNILNGSYKYYNYYDGYSKVAYANDNQIAYIYWSGNSLDPVDFQTLILVAFTGEEGYEQEYFYYSTSPNILNITSGSYNQFNPWYKISGISNVGSAIPSILSGNIIYSSKASRLSESILLGSNINTTGYSYSIILGNENIETLRCQATSITSLSDIRDKRNIEYIDNIGLKFVNQLAPSEFIWNARDGSKKDKKDVGFIAQDILTAATNNNINIKIVDTKDPNKLGVAQDKLIPFIVDAVKELSYKIEDFSNKVDDFNKD